MNSLPTIPLFPSGRLVATPGALALLEQANKSPSEFLSRHLRGDWGDLDQEDKTENELSLKYGFRLLSSYQVTDSRSYGSSPKQTDPSRRCFCPRNIEQRYSGIAARQCLGLDLFSFSPYGQIENDGPILNRLQNHSNQD